MKRCGLGSALKNDKIEKYIRLHTHVHHRVLSGMEEITSRA